MRGAPRTRVATAAAIAIAGAATCVASDYVFGARDPYGATIGIGWDLLLALPFGFVSVLVLVTGMSLVSAFAAAASLAGIAVVSYEWANTNASSTAPVALLAPWTTGIPLVVAVWIVDAAVRAGTGWRGWRRDERRA